MTKKLLCQEKNHDNFVLTGKGVLKGELLVLGLSPLEDKQSDYGGYQDQECNELGDTHVAP